MADENKSQCVTAQFDTKKLLMISIGTFVGSGVVSILGVAAGLTGYSVWLAYLAAVIIGFTSALTTMAISSCMTFNGGVYSLACTFLGVRFSGAFALYSFMFSISIAMMASAFGTYVQSVFPSANTRAFAIGILVIFWAVQCLGIDFMATVQKYSTYILLVAMLVFCVFSYKGLNMDTFNFSGDKFMTGGVSGFFGAMAMLVFSAQTYDSNLLPYGKFTKDSKKVMPKVMIYTMIILVAVYVGTAIAAVGAVDIATASGNPLTDPARAVLPAPLFYAFIVLGPVLCLTTTINGALGGNVITLQKATEDGWFPEAFADVNKRGAAWKIVTVLIGMCILIILFSVNIGWLTSNAVLVISCFQVPLLFSVWKLPDKFPEGFAGNTMKLSKTGYHVLVVVSIIARFIIIFWAAMDLNLVNVLVIIGAVAVCFTYSFLRHKYHAINVDYNYYFD